MHPLFTQCIPLGKINPSSPQISSNRTNPILAFSTFLSASREADREELRPNGFCDVTPNSINSRLICWVVKATFVLVRSGSIHPQWDFFFFQCSDFTSQLTRESRGVLTEDILLNSALFHLMFAWRSQVKRGYTNVNGELTHALLWLP